MLVGVVWPELILAVQFCRFSFVARLARRCILRPAISINFNDYGSEKKRQCGFFLRHFARNVNVLNIFFACVVVLFRPLSSSLSRRPYIFYELPLIHTTNIKNHVAILPHKVTTHIVFRRREWNRVVESLLPHAPALTLNWVCISVCVMPARLGGI